MSSTSHHKRGLPLVAIVTTAIVILVLGAIGAIGGFVYGSSARSVDALWGEAAKYLADRTAESAYRHFEPAISYAHIGQELFGAGAIDMADPEQAWQYLEPGLDAHHTFMWASWARVDGLYQSVYRWPNKNGTVSVRRSFRALEPPDANGKVWTRYRNDERQIDGSWRRIRDDAVTQYDPRTKPWYKAAIAADGKGVWTGPSLMHSRKQLGLFYSLAAKGADGKVAGVWVAEFEAGPLSEDLAGLDLAKGARVYIVDDNGHLIAHPEPTVGRFEHRDGQGLAPAGQDTDPMLAETWLALSRGDAKADRKPFSVGDDWTALASRFPKTWGIPWIVIIAVPEEELFAEARTQARFALWIALATILVALFLALVFSRRLASSFSAVREELQRIEQFEISPHRLTDSPSLVREVNDIARATDTMKTGLRSFQRYAPREVVSVVMESGIEANLGVEHREVSVMFTDIIDFTTKLEAADPDVVIDAVCEYLEVLDTEILRTGGLRLHYLGDGLMAMWGAPIEGEDHALRACRAMLAMDRASDALQAANAEAGKLGFGTRMGLNSGTCLVGNIGAPERFSYSAVGDMVNTASRLEGLNKLYGTRLILGERTVELIGDALVTRKLDLVRVKGKRGVMTVHELLGEPGDVSAEARGMTELYEQALDLYWKREFLQAADRFADARQVMGGDGPCDIMIQRCVWLHTNPPEPEWDGAFTVKTK